MNKLYYLDSDEESSNSEKLEKLDDLLDYELTTELDMRLIKGIFK
jgi:hypothetical protein